FHADSGDRSWVQTATAVLAGAPRRHAGRLERASDLAAAKWLKEGLGSLRQSKKWEVAPRIRYEMDAHNGMFWARLIADSRTELFKALVYDALRDARFNLRFCPECRRPFLPVRRQAYCSAGCSQAMRKCRMLMR